MGESRGRRKYDREFKEDAIRLIVDSGRPVREVARDLGIQENMLSRWKKEYLQDKEHSFSSKNYIIPQEKEQF